MLGLGIDGDWYNHKHNISSSEEFDSWIIFLFPSHGGSIETRTIEIKLFQNKIEKVPLLRCEIYFITAWNFTVELFKMRKEFMIDV